MLAKTEAKTLKRRRVEEGMPLTHDGFALYEDATKLWYNAYYQTPHKHCPLGHPGVICPSSAMMTVPLSDELRYVMSACGTLAQWIKLKNGKACCPDVVPDSPEALAIAERIYETMQALWTRTIGDGQPPDAAHKHAVRMGLTRLVSDEEEKVYLALALADLWLTAPVGGNQPEPGDGKGRFPP